MKTHFKSQLIFVSVVGLSLAGSLAQADIGDAFVLCKHDKMVRTLRVDHISDSQCKAVYTKQGVDQVIGASQMGESCNEYLTKVRKNLEDGKWACRDVKESRVSNLGADEAP